MQHSTRADKLWWSLRDYSYPWTTQLRNQVKPYQLINSHLFLNHHHTALIRQMLCKAGGLLGPYGNRGPAKGLVAVIHPGITSVSGKWENREIARKKADGFAKWKMSWRYERSAMQQTVWAKISRGVYSQRSSFSVLSVHYKGKERISESHTGKQIESVPWGRKAIRYLLWELTEPSDMDSKLKLIILVVKIKSEPSPKFQLSMG